MRLHYVTQHILARLVETFNHVGRFGVSRCVETWATSQLVSISRVNWLVKLVPWTLTFTFGDPHIHKQVNTQAWPSTILAYTKLATWYNCLQHTDSNDAPMMREGQLDQCSPH